TQQAEEGEPRPTLEQPIPESEASPPPPVASLPNDESSPLVADTPSREAQAAAEEALRLDKALDRPVTELAGIGRVKAERLQRLGIKTIRDLLYHAPFRYEDYTAMKQIAELVYGDEVTLAGVVQDINLYKSKRGTIVVTAIIGDGTGSIRAKWFGNRYLVNQLRPGSMVRLSGKIDAYMGRLQIATPRYEIIDEQEVRSGWLVPIYPLTEGVGEKALQRDIAMALEHVAGKIPDPLPDDIRHQFGLADLPTALRWLHHPESMEKAQAARRRLAFDELLRLQLGMLRQRREWRARPGHRIDYDPMVLQRFFDSLPFELTAAQQRAIKEILSDMKDEHAMSRLLQGDVGSGKTVVAAAALLAAVSSGYQGALMAPTEILAEQHFKGLSSFLNPEGGKLLDDRPLRVALLTGSLSASEKEAIREQISSGEVDVAVGTHALIQDEVQFDNLGLAIVDEQHRFGVRQRGALRSRDAEKMPDLLVMSATPIPRSLALTLYGDLDLSVIDEMPPGREPIVTRAITPYQRERAYTYIRRQILEGRQAFVVCPLVEESDKLEARAAVEEHRFLQQEVFPDFQVGLLHGRMKGEEKEREMERFYRNETQILVSTSVVEVGIDVPNASVMLIEGADRFGMAQLHQFRGRIGRGKWRSLCLLMAEESLSAEGEQRLNALVENSDGFALAEADLKMRGPGDFFGTRQSGLPDLKLARLGDTITLDRARQAAKLIMKQDPNLSQPQHRLLLEQTKRYWAKRKGDLS
ncbi:MAG: ATP-dependent DNA helicase RecG, partial [Chloroflexota bacterium]|nr:ATP-dependent DNA helicase RecG [Chloroflexota bacterium]